MDSREFEKLIISALNDYAELVIRNFDEEQFLKDIKKRLRSELIWKERSQQGSKELY